MEVDVARMTPEKMGVGVVRMTLTPARSAEKNWANPNP